MPKKEFDKSWYNSHYAKNIKQKGEYSKNYLESRYLPLWELALSKISKNDYIADFGCGVGMFASLAYDRNYNYSYGIDFSKVAINKAKSNVPNWENKFLIGNLYDDNIFKLKSYTCAVLFEVLEHIQEDIKVLQNIPKNTRVIFSLPSFDYKSHVRFFQNKKQIKQRYSQHMRVKSIKEVHTPQILWLVDAYV